MQSVHMRRVDQSDADLGSNLYPRPPLALCGTPERGAVVTPVTVVLTLAVLCALVHRRVMARRRRLAYERAVERLRVACDQLGVEVGRQLLPAFHRMAAVIAEVSRALEERE
jgi:hypothetical protein